MKKIIETLTVALLKLVSLVLRFIANLISNVDYLLIILAIIEVWTDKNYLYAIFLLLLVCALSVVRIAKTDVKVKFKLKGTDLLGLLNDEERKRSILN